MKNLIVLVFFYIALGIVPVGSCAFAHEPISEKTVQNVITKLVFGDESTLPEKANFYGLRECEAFEYSVEWNSTRNYAVVTKGNGQTLTDGNGNNLVALVIRPGFDFIELYYDEKIAKLVDFPAGYESFIEDKRLYVHSSVFEKYFGLKTVVED